jgi:DnaJ like chaperone protein
MTNDAIRAAWRKLVRDNHPDRLMAQGLPEEFVAMANQKLATINAAYDKIAKERGIP